MPKFDDRFARQNRFGPPSGFPLTSTYSRMVHHLSGPNIYAPTQTFHQRIMVGRWCPSCEVPTHYFHCAPWVCHPNTRTYVRLLGPCFKTGQLRPFRQDLDHACGRTTRSRNVPRHFMKSRSTYAGSKPPPKPWFTPQSHPRHTCRAVTPPKRPPSRTPLPRNKNPS